MLPRPRVGRSQDLATGWLQRVKPQQVAHPPRAPEERRHREAHRVPHPPAPISQQRGERAKSGGDGEDDELLLGEETHAGRRAKEQRAPRMRRPQQRGGRDDRGRGDQNQQAVGVHRTSHRSEGCEGGDESGGRKRRALTCGPHVARGAPRQCDDRRDQEHTCKADQQHRGREAEVVADRGERCEQHVERRRVDEVIVLARHPSGGAADRALRRRRVSIRVLVEPWVCGPGGRGFWRRPGDRSALNQPDLIDRSLHPGPHAQTRSRSVERLVDLVSHHVDVRRLVGRLEQRRAHGERHSERDERGGEGEELRGGLSSRVRAPLHCKPGDGVGFLVGVEGPH